MTAAVGWLLIIGGLMGTVARAADPSASTVLQVMPLGDSITAGYFTTDGGYRRLLQEQLKSGGIRTDFVGRSVDRSGAMKDPEHEGYTGYTIRQIAEKAREALDKFSPDMILLFAGSNDIRVNGDNGDPKDPNYWKTAPERLSDLLAVIAEAAPKAAVFVGTLMPFAGGWSEREPAAIEFNTRLRDIVAARKKAGQKVYLVDFRKTVKVADLEDGLHPNAAGYRKMAKAWYQEISLYRRTIFTP